ncbi:MAG: hypothetical protein JWO06_1766 [Bacteroidota bacterium]|nr:hypothetical protein [Bacteroidota bacterium]
MREYLLLFRRDYQTKQLQPTPDQFQENLKQWGEWFGKLKAEDKIVAIPPRFDGVGKVLDSTRTISDGPYLGTKESFGGFIIIKAGSYEDAANIALDCPVLHLGGNVEIRQAL